jgi:outer membrane protein OmpA-like peptidoglycan-associated protein
VKTLILGATLTALLLGCASAPQRNESLEAARAEFQKLSQEPLAQQAASADVDAARKSLQQADGALQQHKTPEEVNHLAYLTLRHAQAGQARVAEARARQEVAQAEQERNHVLLQARERETQQARSEADTAKNTAQAAQNQLAHARQELQDLQAKQTERGMVMTLNDVLFDTGLATLKPGADRALDRLAQALRDHPQMRVLIEGHTDSRGSEAYNEELSYRRAQAVTRALNERGVPADQYEAARNFPWLPTRHPPGGNRTAAWRSSSRMNPAALRRAHSRASSGGEKQEIKTTCAFVSRFW